MIKPNILFTLNSSKKDSNGYAPIYLRITIDKQRSSHSTGHKAKPGNWNAEAQRITGNSEEAELFEVYTSTIRFKILQIQNDILASGETLSAKNILTRLSNKSPDSKTILYAFRHHNALTSDLIGKGVAKRTFNQYMVTERKLCAFIKSRLHTDDIPLKSLTIKFMADFEHYLKVHDKNEQNTASKYLKILKRVIRYAITNQWLLTNPFDSFHCRSTQTERGFLTKAELKLIEEKTFLTERLSIIRDIFVFGCYTGLSYSDIIQLTSRHISKDDNGTDWILLKRNKTGFESTFPILPKAREILDKYANHPECLYKGTLLPNRSNQRMNEYLGEIGVLCGINKRITCHLARHTFATTITLANGVSTETVAKMLGHKNLRTTQIYAKMTLGRIASEMNRVSSLLNNPKNDANNGRTIN